VNGEGFCTGTAVLITSYVPGYPEALKRIRENFGEEIEFFGFDGYGLPETAAKVTHAAAVGVGALADKLGDMANVVLLAPRLGLLDDIVHGLDAEVPAYLAIRSILWKKNVRLLLDFEPPKNKRNTFYEKIMEAVQALEAIGVGIMTYRSTGEPEPEGYTLITETDVRRAYQEGQYRMRKAADAIVTPAAVDAAEELGIYIA
jgi:hypothetical protein